MLAKNTFIIESNVIFWLKICNKTNVNEAKTIAQNGFEIFIN